MKFFKLHENGKVCKVVSIETNLIGGKGFDAFITIIEPNHCDVEGWDCERLVAACRGEFVDSPIETQHNGATKMKPQKTQYSINSGSAMAFQKGWLRLVVSLSSVYWETKEAGEWTNERTAEMTDDDVIAWLDSFKG